MFLLAGYETTSNLLAYMSYLLATNTDKQEKLLAEIDKVEFVSRIIHLFEKNRIEICGC